MAFFDANGYVIVSDAAPPETISAVIQTLWEFLGMDPNDPKDWYRLPHSPSGMVELYQHQALWDVYSQPRIYEAYTQL